MATDKHRKTRRAFNHKSGIVKMRLYLDVCEYLSGLNGKPKSRTELANYLKRIYKDKKDEKLSHFGFGLKADPKKSYNTVMGKNFPTPQQLEDYVDDIDQELKTYSKSGTRLISKTGSKEKSMYSVPQEDNEVIGKVRALLSGFFTSLPYLEKEKVDLVIAANDSVSNYLIPAVAGVVGENFQVKTRRYIYEHAEFSLIAKKIDLAIGWQELSSIPKLNTHFRNKGNIKRKVLLNSDCKICLIYHPSLEIDKETVSLLRHEYNKKNKLGSKCDKFFFDSRRLQGIKLFYPDLPQAIAVGRNLAENLGMRGVQLDHFAAVVKAVRTKAGFGIFFDQDWVLTEIRQEHRIMHIAIPNDGEPSNLNMQLVAFTRKDDPVDVMTQAATEQANKVIEKLEQELKARKADPRWIIQELKFTKPESLGQDWDLWYITPGPDGRYVAPRWKHYALRWDAPTNETEMNIIHPTIDTNVVDDNNANVQPSGYDGTSSSVIRDESMSFIGCIYPYIDVLAIEPDFAEPDMRVFLSSQSTDDEFLILHFDWCKKPSKDDPMPEGFAKRTVAYFSCQVKLKYHTENDTRRIYLGILSFCIGREPFCAPILLCDQKITLRECQEITAVQFNTFIRGDE